MIGQKIKNYGSFNFWPENLEKFRSTELYGAPLEGSTIFLYHSSLGRKSLESSRLGRLKYAISAGWDVRLQNKSRRKCKKWRPSTIFKHGLLEESTFWFHDSYTCRTPLESSRLGLLKYAVSPSKDLRSKNNRSLNGKTDSRTRKCNCVKSVVSEVWTVVNRCEQVQGWKKTGRQGAFGDRRLVCGDWLSIFGGQFGDQDFFLRSWYV